MGACRHIISEMVWFTMTDQCGMTWYARLIEAQIRSTYLEEAIRSVGVGKARMMLVHADRNNGHLNCRICFGIAGDIRAVFKKVAEMQ